ncbi:hypothetical protein AvCA_29250 [Azotobacter vinelandii CA]|uniref:Uncharacterized protein n=2 Tax=Azotobacter vinelandii TaxID=354 RepID=C1DM07_AZOVD|nr:hypothetical protein Avin_29250 [Azotobacter vinelandii DJ]AGK14816.1 hypothetical protein AvCA_29250 [Azotobacter vinelandii CA]AGK20962.1 hypothetical protein AvCA6_29250 [Azotobacter vinelandii CA6]
MDDAAGLSGAVDGFGHPPYAKQHCLL